MFFPWLQFIHTSNIVYDLKQRCKRGNEREGEPDVNRSKPMDKNIRGGLVICSIYVFSVVVFQLEWSFYLPWLIEVYFISAGFWFPFLLCMNSYLLMLLFCPDIFQHDDKLSILITAGWIWFISCFSHFYLEHFIKHMKLNAAVHSFGACSKLMLNKGYLEGVLIVVFIAASDNHVVTIWVLSNLHAITKCNILWSCDHYLCQLPTSKVSGESGRRLQMAIMWLWNAATS